MEHTIKPPLGLIPERHFEAIKNIDRVRDIISAIARYNEAGKQFPAEWIDELKSRTGAA